MTSRIEIINQTLKSNQLDRTLYEMISDLTAEEWITALQDQDLAAQLRQYLIYTYNCDLIEEIAEKSDQQLISKALVDAFFDVYCGGSTEPESQPSISILGGKPCLKTLFNGHMISVISKAEYDTDISNFIRSRLKQLTSELLAVSLDSQQKCEQIMAGVFEKHPMFPVMHDVDKTELANAMQLFYVLTAISRMTGMLQLETMSSTREAMLTTGDIEGLITSSDCSQTKKALHLKDYKEIEAFITSHFESFVQYFSNCFFDENETSYLLTIYKRGLVVHKPVETVVELDEVKIEEHHLELPTIEVNDTTSCSSESQNILVAIKNKLKSFLTDDESEIEQKTQVQNEQIEATNAKNDDNDINEIIFSSQKKKGGSGIMLFAVIGFIGMVAWMSFIGKEQKNDSSIIEQNSKEESQFKVVIVE